MQEKLMRSHSLADCVRILCKSTLSAVLLSLSVGPVAQSQAAFTSSITPDGTLGTTVTKTAKIFDITGGTIKGTNQFHSFGKFSVGTGDTASFNGPAGILNILSRVTGGQQSQIDGTLKSTISGANLYLMNPAGILFGPNATLNLSGSFHVTTADYLRLGENVRFLAKPDVAKDSLLTSAPVAAFGFLSNSPAPITVQDSILIVPKTKSLSIIGGDITITGGDLGYLSAPGGQINIASVGSPGEAILNVPGTPAALDVSSFSKLGNIELSDFAYLDVGGTVVGGRIVHNTGLVGGTVLIRGGQLVMDSSTIDSSTGNANGATTGIDIQISGDTLITNSSLFSDTEGAGHAGNILVNVGGDLSIVAGTLVTSDSNGTGHAGDIHISAANITLNSLISNDANSTGAGGDITLTARDFFSINDSIVTSSAQDAGNGGKIFITTPKLTMQDSLIQVLADFDGNAGDVTISAGTITINNTVINSSTYFGSGVGGNVTIDATESITMTGIPAQGNGVFLEAGGSGNSGRVSIKTPLLFMDRSELFASTDPGSTANAGDIILNVGKLILKNGSTLESDTLAAGKGGKIDVVAVNSVEIFGPRDKTSFAGITTKTEGSGDAGSISISTPSLAVDQHGIIDSSASNGSTGNAGTISLTADTINLTNGAIISTNASGSGHGGILNINAKQALVLSGADDFGNASIVASAAFSTGDAGSISITTPSLSLNPGAITTSSFTGSGNGGDISVNVANLTLLNGGNISAGTSTSGNSGNLTVNATDSVTISGGSTTGLFTVALDMSGVAGGPITPAVGKGGRITVTTSALSLDADGQISASTASTGDAGEIQVKTGTLTMAGNSKIESSTSLAGTHGNAGTVTINAAQVFLADQSTIDTATFTDGQAGTLTLTATQLLSLSDLGELSSSSGAPGIGNSGLGNAGHITVSTPTLIMTKGLIDVETFGAGNAGGIQLNVGDATLTNGAQISSNTFGAGQGGSVTMIATGSVTFSGKASDGKTSGLFSNTASTGNAGTVTLSAGSLTMADFAEIQSASAGSGSGGQVLLTIAGPLSVSENARLFTGAKSNGSGGDIQVTANQISLNSGGKISAESTGTGKAGNITINAPDRLQLVNGFITTEALQGDGGNIIIHVGSLLRASNSDITATVKTGAGNGGNISIDPDVFVLNHSRIIAEAFGGNGGNIAITAGLLLVSPDSIIDASSALGVNGTIQIQSPVQNLSGSLSPLPATLLTIAPLTSQCAARAQGGSFSSFTVAGRDGIPVEPGGLLPSPLQQASLAAESGNQAATSSNPRLPLPMLLSMNFHFPCTP